MMIQQISLNLKEIEESEECIGYLPHEINPRELFREVGSLSEIEQGSKSSIISERNEYAMKLFFLSKDPTYIKQDDNLPTCHVMDTRQVAQINIKVH